MNEGFPDSSRQGAEGPPPKEAVWHSSEGDKQVKIVGAMSRRGVERPIIQLEDGSSTDVPANEVEFVSHQVVPEVAPSILEQQARVAILTSSGKEVGVVREFIKKGKAYAELDSGKKVPIEEIEYLGAVDTSKKEEAGTEQEVAESLGEIAVAGKDTTASEPQEEHKEAAEEIDPRNTRAAVIKKGGREVVVKDSFQKDNKTYVRLYSGREIPEEDIEYMDESGIEEIKLGEKFIFIRNPGKDEPAFEVKGMEIQQNTQYPDGRKIVLLEREDETGRLEKIHARPREVLQQINLPKGYWRRADASSPKSPEQPSPDPEKKAEDDAFKEIKQRIKPGTRLIDKEGRAALIASVSSDKEYPLVVFSMATVGGGQTLDQVAKKIDEGEYRFAKPGEKGVQYHETKFEVGDEVEIHWQNSGTTSRGKVMDAWVGESNGEKEEQVMVKVDTPEGKKTRVLPASIIKKINGEPQSAQPESPEPQEESSQKPPNQDAPEDPDSKAELSDDEKWLAEWVKKYKDSWFDPRRIVGMKERYESLLQNEKSRLLDLQDKTPLSEHYKNIIKTHVVESELNKIKNHAERTINKYGIGIMPELPGEVEKQKMAAMLDLDWEVLRLASEMADEATDTGLSFKSGQEVRVDGEEGWTVKRLYRHYNSDKLLVEVTKPGETSRYLTPEKLQQYQDQADPDKEKNNDKENLQKLKPFLENPTANVELPDGSIAKGQFQGYKVSYGHGEGKVYYGIAGNHLGEATIDDFLGWQSERLSAEIEAEEAEKAAEEEAEKAAAKAERIKDLEEKLKDYLGKDIVIKTDSGESYGGFKVTNYDPEEKYVYVKHPKAKGDPHPVSLEDFIKWQEEVAEKEMLEAEAKAATEAASEAAKPPEEIIVNHEAAKEESKKTLRQRWAARKAINEAKHKEVGPVSWWIDGRISPKLEALPLKFRVPVMALGGTAIFAAVAFPPAWPLDYLGYRKLRKHAIRQKKKQEAIDQAAQEKAEREEKEKKEREKRDKEEEERLRVAA
jgi:hypothetical protein